MPEKVGISGSYHQGIVDAGGDMREGLEAAGIPVVEGMTIRELCRLSHEYAVSKGFWDAEASPNVPEKLMLAVSELAEALEEYRNGHHLTEIYYTGPDIPMKPEGFPIEIADVFIRLADLCEKYGIDIEHCIRLKMHYNSTRSYRHGGKKA